MLEILQMTSSGIFCRLLKKYTYKIPSGGDGLRVGICSFDYQNTVNIIESTIYDQILIWSGDSEYLIGSCELRDPLHNLMFPRSNLI